MEYATVIHSSGHDLLTLLNDILDLAKVESGTVTLDFAPLRFGPVQQWRCFASSSPWPGGKTSASPSSSRPMPRRIVTDPDRLRQILKNLITNAFKFTQHGEVQLQDRMAARGWSGDVETLVAAAVVAFSVTDTGIGIEQAAAARIFEEFAQGDGSPHATMVAPGSACRSAASWSGLLGGDITVTSEFPRGSTFTVYVPPIHRKRRIRPHSSHGGVPLQPSQNGVERGSRQLRSVLPPMRVPVAGRPRASARPNCGAPRCWSSTTTSATSSP